VRLRTGNVRRGSQAWSVVEPAISLNRDPNLIGIGARIEKAAPWGQSVLGLVHAIAFSAGSLMPKNGQGPDVRSEVALAARRPVASRTVSGARSPRPLRSEIGRLLDQPARNLGRVCCLGELRMSQRDAPNTSADQLPSPSFSFPPPPTSRWKSWVGSRAKGTKLN